jgi:hypothetical protein
VTAHAVERLPVVFDMRVEGKLVACNLEKFKPAALAYIARINTTLTTDQQFADATEDAKYCRECADKLELAIEQALGQMGDINAAITTVREVAEAFEAKGLSLEKLVDARKSEIRLEIHQEFTGELDAHIAALNEALGKPYMPAFVGDWAGVMKAQRTIASLREKCSVELADCKIKADEVFRKIKQNLDWLRDNAKDYVTLFPDTTQLVLKDHEFVVLEANRRMNEHKQAEERRIREAQERQQREAAEAQARQQREAEATAQREQQAAPAHPLPAYPALATEQARVGASTPAANTAAGPSVVPLRAGNPTLKIGDIQDRLGGIPVTAVFIENTLGIKAARRENKSVFFLDTDWDRICVALITHVDNARAQHRLAA